MKQYNCSISLNDYTKFITCGLSYDFISYVYSCGYRLQNNIEEKCPDIIINEHSINMCDFSFNQNSIEQLKNKIKEIKLYENN